MGGVVWNVISRTNFENLINRCKTDGLFLSVAQQSQVEIVFRGLLFISSIIIIIIFGVNNDADDDDGGDDYGDYGDYYMTIFYDLWCMI